MVSLWLFDFFLCHVFSDAVEYIFGFCRSAGLTAGGHTFVDVQAALAVGVSRNVISSGSGAVCLWFLQRYADLNSSRVDYHGVV